MRWLITGGGMLAADVLRAAVAAGEAALPLGRSELDVTDRRAVRDMVAACRPAVVVNCAGWTAVDDAETHEAEALEVNGHAVAALADACSAAGARLVHISTDYVFDGTSREPYPEDAPTCPLNAYGRTKLAGERAALERGHHVVRTAWLYGAAGPNFVRTMTRLARAGTAAAVVDDQRGQPTWAADLAAFVLRLVRSGLPPGVYHGTSSGRRPGGAWPGRCTPCAGPIPAWCARCRAPPTPGRRPGRATACSPTPGARRSVTGATRCAPRGPR